LVQLMTDSGPHRRLYREEGDDAPILDEEPILWEDRPTPVEPEARPILPFAPQGHCASDCCDRYPALHVHGDEAEYERWRLAVEPDGLPLEVGAPSEDE
jgi:hypothetical protein